MASRNERKRRAKARHDRLEKAVRIAFKLEARRERKAETLRAVNHWCKRGTRTFCVHPDSIRGS